MARKTNDAQPPEDDDLALMRKRFQLACDYYGSPYQESLDDVLFVDVPGNQWDKALKARRRNRPTYEFPKLRLHVLQVVNEMRQQRPQGKVRGTEEGDRGLAELMQGLIRNIESVSNADHAYDIAYDFSVKGGFGDWRICTDYLNDQDFEQDIRIEPVRNPFASKPDPAAVKIDLRDARYWFIEDLIPKSEFLRRFPKASMQDFDSDEYCATYWKDADNVKVGEYWYKEPYACEVWLLSDGRVVKSDEFAKKAGLKVKEAEEFLAATGISIAKRREVESHKVYMRLTNGAEWLTEPYEFPSKFIPIVRTWGNIQQVNGQNYWAGLVRFCKDQQRLHNVHRTATVEAVAKAPKAPYMLTAAQIEGLEPMWKQANAEDFPYLVYKPDPANPGAPQRTQQAEVPAALIQLAAMENDDIKAATGIYDASLGARSNETSGVAIGQRKQQGATATFNYVDNLAYAMRYTYEIIGDMVPRVMDTQRVVRILGEDGGVKWKTLYQEVIAPDGTKAVVNDLSKGKYDYTVTVGPSYATQRMEAANVFAQMAGQIGSSLPQLGPLLSYAVIKNQDLPGIEEIDGAVRNILVGQGLLPPKEGEEPPAPQPPNPMQVAQVEKAQADAAYSAARASQAQIDAQTTAMQGPAEFRKLVAEAVQIELENMLAAGQVMAPHHPDMQLNGYSGVPQI